MTATQYLADLGACLTTVIAAPYSLEDAMYTFGVHLRHVRMVHLVGNGGSASVVAHAQNDLVKACGIRALVYQDVPLLTACANDGGYPNSYAQPLSVWLDERDLLVAVSSSGASPNILNAVDVAKRAGTTVVTCSGFKPDNPLRQLGDLNFYVPSSDYGHVELTHAALLHCLTDRLATR